MIELVAVRELDVVEASSPGRSRRISAASGLVVAGNHLYVVMDDEHHLGVFPADGIGEGRLLRLFDGDLPEPRKARKASKPDLEVLVRLPGFADHPHGALLALGSGSRPNRRQGVVLALDEGGAVSSPPRLLDLSALCLGLEERFPALNIEGAVVVGSELCLLQRASRAHPVNACIRFRLGPLLDAIAGAGVVVAPELINVREVDLGTQAGVALAFTDACMLEDGRIIFTAVAEAAKDSYQDGPCAGAALGVLSPEGNLRQLEFLQPAAKVEGVHGWLEGDTIQLWLVTDADDAAIPSMLLSASLRGESAPSAAPGAPLICTSGVTEGSAMGTWQGEPLYHGSLESSEYRRLLGENGFEVIDHVVDDPGCGHATIWLARKT